MIPGKTSLTVPQGLFLRVSEYLPYARHAMDGIFFRQDLKHETFAV